MASLVIRNLDEKLKAALRVQSAQHGCSMEAEVRQILAQALMPTETASDFAQRIHNRFAKVRVNSLPIPPRSSVRNPPDMAG